jgi:hypothetical protein
MPVLWRLILTNFPPNQLIQCDHHVLEQLQSDRDRGRDREADRCDTQHCIPVPAIIHLRIQSHCPTAHATDIVLLSCSAGIKLPVGGRSAPVGGMSATEGTTIEAGFYRHLVCGTVLTCDRNYPYPYSDGHRGAARSYDDSGRCCPSSPLRHDDDTRTSLWHTFLKSFHPLPRHIQRSHFPATGAPDPPPAAVLPLSQPSWGCPALHGRGTGRAPIATTLTGRSATRATCATRQGSICSNLRGRERAGGGDTWSERRLQRSNSMTKKKSTTSSAGRKRNQPALVLTTVIELDWVPVIRFHARACSALHE